MTEPITFVRNAIQRPDLPQHFMVLKALPHEVTAGRDGVCLARSRNAVRMQEAGYDLYDPALYFPRADVNMAALRPSAKTTHCPLKGQNQYYDVQVGDRVLENAAWSLQRVCDFDPRIEMLRDRIAFDHTRIQVTELTVSGP